MKWMVLILFFAALLCDVYIYRSVILPHFRRPVSRIAYIVFAIVTDAAALASLFLYGLVSGGGSTAVITVMWSMWLFALTLTPKILYTLGGLLDRLSRLVSRRRIVAFRVLAVFLSIASVVVMIYGATAGRTALRVEEVEICSAKIPASFDGYRIVQISDVHVGTMCDPARRIERLAEKIAELDPDMVVSTGDVMNIDHRELTPEVIVALSRITAPDGVWGAWGNHDLGFYIGKDSPFDPVENFEIVRQRMGGTGWTMLTDESRYIERGGDSILLSGLNYPTMGHHGLNSELGGSDIEATFEGIEGDPYSIVLAHTPQMWNDIIRTGHGDLTLSGHTHALQMKIRLFGKEFSPARYIYDEWSGKYEKDSSKEVLYVNDGMGCVGYPLRVGARPEVTLIKLKRCE